MHARIPLFAPLVAALAFPGEALPAVTYDDVAPIFTANCVVCHSGEAAPLMLRLDSLANILKGDQRGPVVKAGDVAGSELLRRIRGEAQPRMPLVGGPLSAEQIANLERWVADGLIPGKSEAKSAAPAPAPRPKPGEPVTWSDVAPTFLQRCAKCHSDNGIMGPAPEGYRLSSYEAALAPADRARIIPGNPGASEVARRIRGESQPRMPFDGPPWLSANDIALIEEWIRQGAPAADGKRAPVPVGARVRFGGTLTSQWAVDGTPIVVDGGTRIDKGPRIGDRVEVRGTVDADGAIHTDRLRRR